MNINVLGLKTCKEMKLVQRIDVIGVTPDNEYKDALLTKLTTLRLTLTTNQ